MATYHPDLLAQPVPRYTSYPTAAEFGGGVGHLDMMAALDNVSPDEAVSLYVHIPFCQEICWYCGCNTAAANRVARLAAYLDRLLEEVQLVAARLAGRGRVARIAFGGGSPNALAPSAFERLVGSVRAAFRCSDPVLSIELDPRGFDAGWAAALARTGVSRASLGVQTFDPAVQRVIGRLQPDAAIRQAVTLLREAGIQSLNVDLMYGLPHQTNESLAETIEIALTMAPDRLAVFGYAHVPHLLARQRRIEADTLPSGNVRFEQAALARTLLVAAGYVPIGFDHFARPGDALAIAARDGTVRRNFQGFTEDQADVLIGLGASAISAFPDRLLQNEKNSGRYHLAIAAGRFATARGVLRTAEDRIRGRAIEQLLSQGSADLRDLLVRGCLRAHLLRFEQRGLIGWRDTRLTLAADAQPYARSVAAALDAYREPHPARFSHAV